MGFKKIRYNDGEEIFEVKIKNSDGSFLANWVFKKGDFYKFVNIIEKKYGFSKEKKNEDRDLDWAK